MKQQHTFYLRKSSKQFAEVSCSNQNYFFVLVTIQQQNKSQSGVSFLRGSGRHVVAWRTRCGPRSAEKTATAPSVASPRADGSRDGTGAASRRQKPSQCHHSERRPRRQKNAGAEYFELSSDEEVAPARGMRPAPLWEPRPQERVQRHIAEQIIETFVPVPIIDVSVPQSVDQPVDVLKIIDISSPVEQVIDVPTIIRTTSRSVPCSVRRSWRNSWWKCQQSLVCRLSSRWCLRESA